VVRPRTRHDWSRRPGLSEVVGEELQAGDQIKIIARWNGSVGLPIAEYAGARVQRARVDRESLGGRATSRYILVDADSDRLVVPSKITPGGSFRFSYVG
jgi:hypothetical protein